MNRLLRYLHKPAVRWLLTITWTTLTLFLTLSPSGDGTTVSWVSKLFGGAEKTDAVGHIIINATLAFLWCWTLSLYTCMDKAIRIVLVGGIVWCFTAELSQFLVPERGSSLLDLMANVLGVLFGLVIYRQLIAFSTRRKLSVQQ